MKQKPTIVISGANGYLAQNFLSELRNRECDIVALTHDIESAKQTYSDSRVRLKKLVFDGNLLEPCGFDKCDVLINFAWKGIRGKEQENKQIQGSNVNCIVELVKKAINAGAKRIIQIGSLSEFGLYEDAITEDTESNPVNEYGKAKLCCAKALGKMCMDNGVEFIELRMGSVYGGTFDNSIIRQILEDLIKERQIEMTTKCSQDWEFIYIDDVVKVLMEATFGENIALGTFPVSTGETRPLKSFILECENITGKMNLIKFGEIEDGIGCKRICTNSEMIKALIKGSTVPFENGVRNILEDILCSGREDIK